MKHLEHLLENKRVFFNYMNETYTIFQYSNIFLRDVQYAIMHYFELKGFPVKYPKAETLAEEYLEKLTESNELIKIDEKSWKITFEVGIKKAVAEEEGAENE